MGKPFIDRTGTRFGRLIAKRFLGKPIGKTKPAWECECDCGNIVIVTSSNLATGHTTSCGCYHSEVTAAVKRQYAKEDAAEYQIWRNVKQRTGTKAGKNSRWYSGVEMCVSWRNSFDTFLKDMGKRPSTFHSIERLDTSKGYFPENCIWATPKEQANNRRTNVVIECSDEKHTISGWAERTSLKQATISARLRRGWRPAQAVSLPLNTRINNVAE